MDFGRRRDGLESGVSPKKHSPRKSPIEEMPPKLSPQKRGVRRTHRRSSSAPVFLDQFNASLSPLSEDAEEPEEEEAPKEDRSMHWLNVSAIKRQRELQRLSPLGRSSTDAVHASRPSVAPSPLARASSHSAGEDSDPPSSPERDMTGEEEDECAQHLKCEVTVSGAGADGAAGAWPSEAERSQLDQLLVGSLSHRVNGSVSAGSSPMVRRSTVSKDFSYPSRLARSRSSSSSRGCLKSKSLSDEQLSRTVMFNENGTLYRTDSIEGLTDSRERVRAFKHGPLRSNSPPPPS
eukprot:m.166372 g.166372  ORF g.166372 m.166372 type:complete len:292 (+) comp24039_c0_seq3:415-1290(+)